MIEGLSALPTRLDAKMNSGAPGSDGLSEEERLVAIEAIKVLKARYFRFVDTKDWSGLTTIFAEDAELHVTWTNAGDDDNIVRSSGEIVELLRSQIETLVTVHHGHMPEINVTSPTTAVGIWAMEDVIFFPEGPTRLMRGYGHYDETYIKIDGVWQIRSLKLTRLRMDFEPS